MKSEAMTYQVMRPKGWMGLLGFMGLFVLLCLTGCSSDEGDEPGNREPVDGPVVEQSVPVELMCGVTGYQNAYDRYGATRAVWNPPTGFVRDESRSSEVIGICFTRNDKSPTVDTDDEKLMGYFFKSGNKWRTDLKIKDSGIYYLYGYTPHTTGVSCEITSSNYESGAVLTIKNLPTVTSSDVCVVVGAKNGKDYIKNDQDYSITGFLRGDFAYEAMATSSTGATGNYVFLLFDHLYAAMRFKMKVDDVYNTLRTIKVKELRLKTSSDNTATKKRANALITLTKTNDGSDPITGIEFNQIGNEESDGTVFQSTAGQVLTTDIDDTEFQSHFMPQGVTKLILTSVYDVYDKQNKLVRENCTAVNTLVVSELFSQQQTVYRGNRYTVNLTIEPTYLYLLSEPDLDNPTIRVN